MTIGTVLSGRYVIEEIVGTGGMAVVYRAWDNKAKQIVAVKVLRPEYQQDKEFLRRFSREAEAASKVSHENIVGMYDVGEDGDTRYIVMEYIDGTTLKDMIRQMGHLGPDAVVRMGIRILAAVDHAHKNGIVHRDIKPQNILVDSQGMVKVADFGIARMKAQQTTKIVDANSSALGSVHYISPEQASGEVADEKSDLYSVGVVLYEMLAGHVPFDGDTAVSVALKHVSESPRSLREAAPDISKALDEVVLRALMKKSEDRYQTAAEMAADLRKALGMPDGGFVKQKKTEPERGQKKSRPRERKEHKHHRELRTQENRQHRTSMMRKVMYSLAGVLIACVLFLMVMGVWFMNHVRMPDVEGLTMDAAYATLPDTFNVMLRQEYNNFVPTGSVIAQSPEANDYIAKNGEVYLTVSLGSKDVVIEDYTGWMYDEAMSQLVAAGIEHVEVIPVLSNLPVGSVVSQEPAAGLVPRDQLLVLNVSGERVMAPSLLDYTLENAIAKIEAEGLELGTVSQAYSADAAAGTVIAQSLAPNSETVKGSKVDLTIAQSQDVMYYPESDFRVVCPLDNTKVEVTLTSPTGVISNGFTGYMNSGTYAIELSSTENGVHRVAVYLDGVLLEDMQLTFN